MVCAVVAAAIGYGASWTVGPRQAARVISVSRTVAPLSGRLSLVTTSGPRGNTGSAQLVREVGTEEIAVGSPLVSFQFDSGTYPLVSRAPGVLWLYELGSSTPPTVWRISDSTGAVLQKTTAPALVRPLLASDATGLYLAGAGSFGGAGHGLIFHVGVDARAADEVLGTGQEPGSMEFVTSLQLLDGKVTAVVCTRPIIGPDARPCRARVIAERS